ncbi:viperin family antiviral radical SAM protein [Moritella yayanosii]|uniref:S-adenosylmethionine-dependent nucleotide dehydratase n=1 Tax=Moritella yayanosii TaxID=69539 RepID=A0A330LKB8_9GAMM|nr:viperin family antiviral radical SAM protein [Moritella yayanosii]SQD76696.1 Radical SAM domain protein (modular protein) [Moritella yayanosii]
MNTFTTSFTPLNELVINYHITEACNYACKFCYAKWNKPNELHSQNDQAEQLLQQLADYFIKNRDNLVQQQMPYRNVRLNFAGGEPLILKQRFAEIANKAAELGFNLSLITNGHYLTNEFIDNYANLFSMIGISFDSLFSLGRIQIGRVDRKGYSLTNGELLSKVARLRAVNPAIKIKINTVVNSVNQNEDFNQLITQIAPYKWKVLRVLPVLNDNLTISKTEFDAFVTRHNKQQQLMSVEDNQTMVNSYLMLDPKGRFYKNEMVDGDYQYSDCLLESSVKTALTQTDTNWQRFAQRYQTESKSVVRKANKIKLLPDFLQIKSAGIATKLAEGIHPLALGAKKIRCLPKLYRIRISHSYRVLIGLEDNHWTSLGLYSRQSFTTLLNRRRR